MNIAPFDEVNRSIEKIDREKTTTSENQTSTVSCEENLSIQQITHHYNRIRWILTACVALFPSRVELEV